MNIKSATRYVIINLLYSLRLTSTTFSNKGLFTILTFHRVLPQSLRTEYPLPVLVITPEELHWIMHTLVQFYDCGTVSDMVLMWKKNEKPKKPLMAITFDDGQEDNYRFAVPVLKDLGIKATFFIPASTVDEGGILWHDLLGFTVLHLYGNGSELYQINEFLGVDLTSCRSRVEAARMAVRKAKLLDHQQRIELIKSCTDSSHCPGWAGMMTWKQLREMAQLGHEIGSHSMTHSILPRCSTAELQFEIVESRKMLHARIDAPIASFCYPNGDFDERVVAVVEKAGYTCAVTTQWKANRAGDSSFNLGRCDIYPASFKDSREKLSSSMLAWRLSSLQRLLEQKQR